MKLVFTLEETAAALGKSPGELETLLPHLRAHGFPAPIAGLEDRWSIMEVMAWVNRRPPGEGPARDRRRGRH